LQIIESDGQYKVGEKSHGYKYFHPHNQADLLDYTVQDKGFGKKLEVEYNNVVYINNHPGADGKYEHLTQWFNSNLRIDEQASIKFYEVYSKLRNRKRDQ